MSSSWQVLEGDAVEVLRTLDAESVQTVVTSPPYWGLRDYGTATWEGGDSECDHEAARIAIGNTPSRKSTLTTNNGKGPKEGDKFSVGSQHGYAAECPCGAKRIDSQLGLEPTPEEYVANLVSVFREVRRVLRDDGTVWLNLGDSYAGSWGAQSRTLSEGGEASAERRQASQASSAPLAEGLSATQIAAHPKGTHTGSWVKDHVTLKPKDLVGIPWRVAFALQADGWWLRSDIIWAKPNPMPESVTDRPTRAHEYIFLLTKSARYFYDADAIREAYEPSTLARNQYDRTEHVRQSDGSSGDASYLSTKAGGEAKRIEANAQGRNARSVWQVATQPFPGAHFATFPPKLIEPCILAGSPEDGTVLDPFCGSGTTGLVALRHNRSFIGVELNPTYAEMARNRIRDDAPLLNTGIENVV